MPIGETNIDSSFAQVIRVLLLAKPKEGKTTTALTASAQCPTEFPCKQPVELQDTYIISFEDPANAFLAPQAYGLRFGNNIYDMSQLRDIVNNEPSAHAANILYQKTMADMRNKVKERMADKALLVVDGLSTFDSMLETVARKTTSTDKAFWGVVKDGLTELMDFVAKLKKTTVITAHVRAEATFRGDKNDTTAKALFDASNEARSIGEGELRAELTGKGGSEWNKYIDAAWPVCKERVNGKDVVKILPQGGSQYQGGGRFPMLNPAGEVAHLGTIFKKIRAGMAQGVK